MNEYYAGISTLKMMSRHTLTSKIDSLYESMKNQMISLFANAKYISLTSDIWSCKHRSFMGMTAHYIDPNTFNRHILTISCDRFTFPHTNERIAEHLQIKCDSYGIGEKIVATTTDNASNFAKAFREFGLPIGNYEDNEMNELGDEIEYIEMTTALSSQVRCASHTFSLVGVNDAANAQKDSKYFSHHTSAFTKLNRLWKCSKQPKAAEIMVEILDFLIRRPIVTRWNALFDCLMKILGIDMGKLNEVMRALNIPEFTAVDIQFLHEYVTVLKPIAKATDCLQAECHFAYLLPVVHKTVRSLTEFNGQLKFCQPLLEAVLRGVEERFDYCFDFDNEKCTPAIIATCTHPYFKMQWLTGIFQTTDIFKKIRNILISAAVSIEIQVQTNQVCSVLPSGILYIIRAIFCLVFDLFNFPILKHFFCLGGTPKKKKKKSFDFGLNESTENVADKELEAETDITTFLRKSCATNDNDYSQLHQHIFIAELFKKFNVICTSSAPAERLFSFAGMFISIHM